MDQETIDENSGLLSEEAINETISLIYWMNFTGVILVIINLLLLLLNLTYFTGETQESTLSAIIINLVAVIMAFMLIYKAEVFKRFVNSGKEEVLIMALQKNLQFWKFTVLISLFELFMMIIF